METKYDALVIGGGVIGLCTAWHLARAGARTAVVDKSDFSDGASRVNAGLLVPSHIEPIAAPGVIAQGIKWMADPESPFYIKPRVDANLTRWLWAFRAACTRENVERAVPILRDLALAAMDLFDDMAALPGFEDIGFAHTGLLMVHNSEKSERANMELADLADEAGVDVRRLSGSEALELEPEIRTPMHGAVFFRQDALFDPERFMDALYADVVRRGVRIFPETTVSDFETEDGRVTGVRIDGETIRASNFVLAAGAWSAALGKKLGLRLSVEPATGYSITVENPQSALRIPVIVTDQKVTVTPMPGRLRFGGTLTLVGFSTKIDMRRVRPLERQARLYCPELGAGEGSLPAPRSGFRPCTTDGLPVIGRPERWQNVVVTAGHGMLGMTEGPITGSLAADLVAGREPEMDISALSPDRF